MEGVEASQAAVFVDRVDALGRSDVEVSAPILRRLNQLLSGSMRAKVLRQLVWWG